MSKTKSICLTALGIALYACVSMLIKIPVVGHISLDLGYIVLAVYCYIYGGVSGAVVGACGCFLVSLIATGWIAVGWPLGNLLIGALCGVVYKRVKGRRWAVLASLAVTVVAVFIGVGVIKTVVECALYSLPLAVKFAKNLVAFAMDATVMCAGFFVAQIIERRINPPKNSSYDVARSAIRKLAQDETDPSKYTKDELVVLYHIAFDKYIKTDMSFVDVGTSSGLSRLSYSLGHHKTGYKYYMDKFVFGTVN